MNRIFAEQNHQTESYLPLREPSIFRRPLAWMSSLATVGAVAVLTLVFLRSDRDPEVLDNQPVISAAVTPTAATEQTAQFASVTRRQDPPSVWEYILGVSGERSNYRATNVSHARSLKLADAKIESLYVEHMRRMGLYNKVMNKPIASFATSQYQSYRPYVRPVNPYHRSSPDSPLLPHASWR